ncbi:MAG: site-specific DNA-methyltransferase [Saprospiraceae bacterium]|nr:site-specific DNA-methyltransferase [Candidatus Defluviibacterium haderslevense]
MENINDYMPLSSDLNKERLDSLKKLFPDLFTNEGKLNIDELKKVVDPKNVSETERYEFRWFGKSQAKRNAFTPSNATLVYDENRSVNPTKCENTIIEGENLEVLKLLSDSYREKIKCIYIDPPYNKDKDFVYKDIWKQDTKGYWEDAGVVENGFKIDTNAETDGRYHSNWLNMIYSRLLIARQFLKSDGVIFISIDDSEVHHLRKVGDEVFGEENWIGTIVWKNATDNNPTQIAIEHEYVHCYAKDKSSLENEWKSQLSDVKEVLINIGNALVKENDNLDILITKYNEWYRAHKSELWPLDRYKYIDTGGVYTGSQSVHNPGKEGYRYDVLHPVTIKPCKQPLMGYRFPKDTMTNLINEEKILFGEDETKIIELKVYAKDYEEKLSSIIDLDGRIGSYDLKEIFPNSQRLFTNPKPYRFINSFLPFVLKKGDIILDFFGGSGSTGHSVFELNQEDFGDRKFILIQIPEATDEMSEAYKAGYKKISDITIERNKRVVERIVEERKKEQPDLFTNGHKEDSIKGLGFKVFKLVKSNFPRVEFAPDPEKTDEENIELLKKYIRDKEAQLITAFNRDELLTEILLKKGFNLNYTTEKQEQFKKNEIYLATDPASVGTGNIKETLICLDVSIHMDTVEYFKKYIDKKFICLERALDTSKKYNLKHYMGDMFNAF